MLSSVSRSGPCDPEIDARVRQRRFVHDAVQPIAVGVDQRDIPRRRHGFAEGQHELRDPLLTERKLPRLLCVKGGRIGDFLAEGQDRLQEKRRFRPNLGCIRGIGAAVDADIHPGRQRAADVAFKAGVLLLPVRRTDHCKFHAGSGRFRPVDLFLPFGYVNAVPHCSGHDLPSFLLFCPIFVCLQNCRRLCLSSDGQAGGRRRPPPRRGCPA